MPVYMIRAGETPNLEIGWAPNVNQRLAYLQSVHYEPLRIVRTLRGGPLLRAALHTHFSKFRGRGEWFIFQPEMLTIKVRELPPCAEDAHLVALLTARYQVWAT